MRRIMLVLAALVALATTLAAPTVRADDAGWHTWQAPTGGAFRQARYEAGELVYTNTLFQGMGANSDRVRRDEYFSGVRPASDDVYRLFTYDFFGMHRVAHNGDYALPTDAEAYPDGTGEIAELRLAVGGDELFVRWRFTSMPRPDAQIATLAFATEGAATPATDWPRGANVRSPWSAALSAWGSGGAIDRSDGTSTPITVRTVGTTMEARVPLAALPAGPWSLTGGAGLHDPLQVGRYWFVPPGQATPATPGNLGASDAAVWSLLFARDQPWTFDEERQAEMLYQGDASQARLVVDPLDLEPRPLGVRTGRMTRMFESRLDLGDGIRRGYVDFTEDSGVEPSAKAPVEAARWWSYDDALQSYSLYVPSSYPTATDAVPLVVYLHGLNGTAEEAFGPVLGLEEEVEDRGWLLAGALGRGDNLYEGAGEVDVLEVIADVSARYRVDPDRIYLMGHSMGAQGTYAVALRNPDVFAAVAPVETLGSVELWRNSRNVPWLHVGAVFDADADSSGAKEFYADRSAAGWEGAVLNYQSKTHEYSAVYDSLPRIFRWFEGHRRERDPAQVSYTLPPAEDPKLGLVHDGAYWVSGMVGAPGASIDVETFGRPHAAIDATASARTVRDVSEGGRSGGDTLAELLETTPSYGPVIPATDRATVVARGLSALTLDAGRMGITLDARLDVDTDTTITITLVLGDETRTLRY